MDFVLGATGSDNSEIDDDDDLPELEAIDAPPVKTFRDARPDGAKLWCVPPSIALSLPDFLPRMVLRVPPVFSEPFLSQPLLTFRSYITFVSFSASHRNHTFLPHLSRSE